MALDPFFNLTLTGIRIVLYRRETIEWWKSENDARMYVHDMCIGLTTWSTMCVIGTTVAIALALFDWLTWQFVPLVPAVCVFCATAMAVSRFRKARRWLSIKKILDEMRVYFRQ